MASSTTRKWLVGCGLGCGGLIVLSIAGPLLFGMVLTRPMDRALEIQKELVKQHGEAAAWAPPAGPPTPERLEAFLAVRRAVMPQCAKFTKAAEDFAHMDKMGKDSDKPDKGELFRAVAKVSGTVFGMIGDIAELHRLRDEALLAQEMGLGEYDWIYTLAFQTWLGNPVTDSIDGKHASRSEADGEDRAKVRQLDMLAGLVRREADALEKAGQAAEAAIWRAEAERMERAEDPVPFSAGGLPEAWAAAFDARGDDLRAAWCAPMAEHDLSEVKKSGFSYHVN
jgi:hypothetical protein